MRTNSRSLSERTLSLTLYQERSWELYVLFTVFGFVCVIFLNGIGTIVSPLCRALPHVGPLCGAIAFDLHLVHVALRP